VWEAQLTMRALPAMGLPGLTVSTNLIDTIPVGVQIVAAHYRVGLCFLAGKAIEARGAPLSPMDLVL
jgi:amidase